MADLLSRDVVTRRPGVMVDNEFHPRPFDWHALRLPDASWSVSDGLEVQLIGLTTQQKDAVLTSRIARVNEWLAWAEAATASTIRPIKVPRRLGDAEAEQILADYVRNNP